jgi:uncharacterized protein YjbI with pentapeptide repeats
VSAETARTVRADPGALDVLAEYRVARDRGEWRRLMLGDADLRDTDMSELDLDECDLSGAVLDGVRFVGASLVRSRLVGASLLGADLSFANLDRADLEGADATAASFVSASLRRADLGSCRLHRADLSDADLSHANLYKADLKGANLTGALAAQANLSGAVLEDTVLTSLRGEPLFGDLPGQPSSATSAGWPAARLAEPQLLELAELYLNTHGWSVIEPPSWGDDGVDLVAQRDESLVVVQVKATATPSSQTFAHLARRLKRAAEGHPDAQLILVMPGPVPKSIEDLARANQVGVLLVWIDENAMRVEEITGLRRLPRAV